MGFPDNSFPLALSIVIGMLAMPSEAESVSRTVNVALPPLLIAEGPLIDKVVPVTPTFTEPVAEPASADTVMVLFLGSLLAVSTAVVSPDSEVVGFCTFREPLFDALNWRSTSGSSTPFSSRTNAVMVASSRPAVPIDGALASNWMLSTD